MPIYHIFKTAAAFSGSHHGRKKNVVLVRETVSIVAFVLLIDVIMLIVWTSVDPLYWNRQDIMVDKFGYVLESGRHCMLHHWILFTSIIGTFHLVFLRNFWKDNTSPWPFSALILMPI